MKAHLHKAARHLKSKLFFIPLSLAVVVLGLLIAYWSVPAPAIMDGYLPGETRKLSTGTPITVRFSQTMNQASVEEHFLLKPTLAGSIGWADGHTFQFTPTETLRVGTTYTVTLGAETLNWAKKPLGLDYVMKFEVSGPPYAKFISPYLPNPVEAPLGAPMSAPIDGKSEEPVGFVQGQSVSAGLGYLVIGPKQPITVMFDRPMRALEGLGETSETPTIEITPPVKGSSRWLGTTAFQFMPDSWTMSTVYTLTLPKGIQALDGSTTVNEVTWTLATESPRILGTTPIQNNDVFPVDGSIELVFNQPMDLDDVKPSENILLYPSNDSDADRKKRNDGFFNTTVVYGKDKDGKVDRSILVFKPEFKYLNNQEYRLVVKQGLPSAAARAGEGFGQRLLGQDFELKFKTVKMPGITAFAPKPGESAYDQEFVWIDFESPMTKELILSQIEFSPKPDGIPEISLSNGDRHADIWAKLDPSTSYRLNFKAPFKDAAGNKAPKGFTTSFKTAPYPPYLTLLTRSGFALFPERLNPTFPMKMMNVKTIDVEVCDLSEAEFMQKTRNYSWYQYRCPSPERKTIETKGTLNQISSFDLDLKQTFGHPFGPGLHFFSMSSPEVFDYDKKPRRYFNVFMVSDTSLTLKKSSQDLLVWATDLVSGQPVARMELSVLSDEGKEILTGVTDGNGIFKISKPLGENLTVVGRKKLGGEDRWSIVHQYWDNGIQTWQFGANGDWVGMNEPRIYVYTDRPLYKGGDEVFFRGIYRMDRDAALSLPTDRKISVKLQDPDYNDIDTKEVKVLPDGSFNGSFTLGSDPRLGIYNLYAEAKTGGDYPQRFYANFYVEQYKKPKFKVELLSSKVEGILGEPLPVDVSASYYFGGAVRQGKVRWSVMRDTSYFDRYKGPDYYSFSAWDGFSCLYSRCNAESKIVAEGEGTLDDQGRLHLEVPTNQEAKPGNGYLYTLNVEIQDQDGTFVSNRQTTLLHPGTYYVGLGMKNYLATLGDSATVRVITVGNDGKPVGGKRVKLQLSREEWKTVKKQGVDGAFYEESERQLIPVTTKTVVTGLEAVDASFELAEDYEGGSYVVRGESDDSGRLILAETQFYVSSRSYVDWGASNNNRMELVPDKPEYFVGGKARVLVKSPFGSKESPAKALITYERGTLRHYEVTELKSNSDFIEVPITADLVPNAYVTVTVMKEVGSSFKDFLLYQDWHELRARQTSDNDTLERLKKEIADLEASTDPKAVNRNAILLSRKRAELEKTQTELLETLELLKASDGKEPEAVAYDLIRPDFRMGVANLRVNRREQAITVDIKTTKPSYRIGEPVTIEVKTQDYQNRPVPSTFSLAVVDESLLALKANTIRDPIDYFLGSRALQVNTATNLTLVVDRVNVASGNGGKGGGGGETGGYDKKRGDFKDTAYFDPEVTTDQGGYAKISFLPPDNLTTWQVLAVATNGKDKFGLGKMDFMVSKPVSLSPILPRFAVSGDTFTFGALAHNQTDQNQIVRVKVEAPGLRFKGGSLRSATVKPGTAERLDFEAQVEPVARDTSTTVEFQSDQDTVVETLPIHTFLYPEVVATNGRVDEVLSEKVRVPTAAVADMGGLDLRAGASLATQFLKDFKVLLDYPYGCAEQLTSRILPLLVIQSTLAEEGQNALFTAMGFDPVKASQIIEDTLVRLAEFQHFDGGYGFWKGGERSYPMLTSYILFAQGLAKKAGLDVNLESIRSAQLYLWRALNAPENDREFRLTLSDRAFVLWALSETSQPDTGMALQLFEKRKELPLFAQALLLMDLKNLRDAGQKSVTPLMDKLKAEIVAKQVIDDRAIHFEDEDNWSWDLSSDLRTTSMVLWALNRDNPDNPLLPNMVNYLTHSSRAQRLANTQETAWMLMALLHYAKSQGDLDANFSFEAEVNGSKTLDGKFTQQNLFEIFQASIPMGDLKEAGQVNDVTFSKEGAGNLLYDMEFKYFLPNEVLPPAEHGFFLERSYTAFEKGDTKTPTTDFRTGELYRGTLNLIVPEDMHFVVVEERLPAGFEALNFDLDTVDTSLQAKLEESTRPDNPEEGYWWDNPLWYFNHIETRDDRVLLFADDLPKGVYTYHFLVRAGQPGKYHHLPASATEMYFPETFGRTGGEWVEIK